RLRPLLRALRLPLRSWLLIYGVESARASRTRSRWLETKRKTISSSGNCRDGSVRRKQRSAGFCVALLVGGRTVCLTNPKYEKNSDLCSCAVAGRNRRFLRRSGQGRDGGKREGRLAGLQGQEGRRFQKGRR